MPYLAVTTNAEIPQETSRTFLLAASKTMAAGTGKPETYVMVKLDSGRPLLFAGTDAPAAFLEVKSIGFPAGGVQKLAASLCDLVTKHLGIPGNRTFVTFQDVAAALWAHNGETFG